MNIIFLKKKYEYKNLFLNNFSKNFCLENSNFVILFDGFWENLHIFLLYGKFIYNVNKFKLKINLNLIYNLNYFYKYYINIGISEYDLKGVNYWFSLLKNILFLDLGKSHFQIMKFFENEIFFKVKKKWLKWLMFISFNKARHCSISNFFWFKLKSVGPYKLKGFQFVNERVQLKEGKKPFK